MFLFSFKDANDEVEKTCHRVIIDMESVSMIDMTGIVAIENMIQDLQSKDIKVVLCGKEEITKKIRKNISKKSNYQIKIFNDVNHAVENFDLQKDNFSN